MRMWPLRRWLVAAAVTVLAALVIGVPTGVIPTPFYTRMTPVLWWNYPVWAISSVLEGLLVATYVRLSSPAPAAQTGRPLAPAGGAATRWAPVPEEPPAQQQPAPSRPRSGRAIAAGVLSAFAVGCPICNKLVVLAIGVSGALSYWAPAQPVLAVASVALLTHALVRRLRTVTACPIPS
ncbi:hypothetical protein [Streptomyces sp. WAC00263]|uniref:hypothetical protein n=1 Tax=Streptomyces sp. WAC00263 TaxID=1917422 RepID=UPI0015EF7F39|nr:hypothetical protein [Streptomyces sp. WAC00263]KAF5999195.1 hypothetical protein BOG92_000465 [Streptomyces sp. WAC00263]